MKIILMIVLSILFVSCAHHHKRPKHHHHAYEKQCAYSVAHGNLEVQGSSEHKIEHGGKTYFFSSSRKKQEFSENLENNINVANKNWSRIRDSR